VTVGGCVKKAYPPGRYVVRDVELENVEKVEPSSVLAGLATAKSPRFLGIWDGVAFEYQVFDKTLLAKDLERIEKYYQARGYYEAKVTAARVVPTDSHHVIVQIRVQEGQAVLTRRVNITGIERLPISVATDALKSIRLQPGKPFDQAVFEDSKSALGNTLADAGYAFVKVKASAQVDVAHHAADVLYEVTPGKAAKYGPIRIQGLTEIPEGPVRSNLLIHEGDRYSRADLHDAQDALVNLGVFASVDVHQDLSKPDSGVVPITVYVRESSLRTVRVGGGVRADVLRLAAHLRLGWEDRNFLGGMRQFSIDTKPGVTFFPAYLYNLAPKSVHLLPENYATAELRQPSFIEGRTTGFVAGQFNIYPLLYQNMQVTDRVLGYKELIASTGVERAFFGFHLYVTPSYNAQANFPFTYQGGDRPAGLGTVLVLFPELVMHLDFRDNRVEPHSGFYISNSFQAAGWPTGGDVKDIRERPEVRVYVPISRGVTLAVRTTVGLLFPENYGKTLDARTAEGKQALQDPTNAAVVADQEKLLFRAFYSGGPDSNRGYPYEEVGPHGPVGFLVPTGVNCVAAENVGTVQCTRPLGGLTMWEASMEVRFHIVGPLSGATFLDASDVTLGRAEFDFDYPHPSPGIGVRYATPVGPLRFDIAYRLPPYIKKEASRPPEGTFSTFLGMPLAAQIALGEAF
jgi:outer membrane protein assembly factor BamA